MTFDEYIQSLNPEQLEAFAERARVSVNYLTLHLMPRRKVPRKELMRRLADSAAPKVERLAVLEHFYPEMFKDVA